MKKKTVLALVVGGALLSGGLALARGRVVDERLGAQSADELHAWWLQHRRRHAP